MAKNGTGSEPITPMAELKPLLHLARRKPLGCAVAMDKGKQGHVLLHRRTKPKKLLAELKRQAKASGIELDPTSLRFGRASVDGASDSGMMTFTVNKPAPGPMRRALLEQVRPAGLQRCEIVVDEGLENEPDGEDGEGANPPLGWPHQADGSETPASGTGAMSPNGAPYSGAMATGGQNAGASSETAAQTRAIATGPMATLLELAKRVPSAVAADPTRKQPLLELVAKTQQSIRTGDTQRAVAGLETLRSALPTMDAQEGGTTDAGGGGPSPGAAPSNLVTPVDFPSPGPDAPFATQDSFRPSGAADPPSGPGGAAISGPGNSDPLARRQDENTQDWEARLGAESNQLTRRQEMDPDGANAARLRMNEAIAADPEFQESYYAGEQGLSVEGFHNAARYGRPVTGFPANPNLTIEQRLLTFIGSNANPYVKMGADGVVYTFRDAPPEAFQAQSGVAALFDYNEQSANNPAQQAHRDGLQSLPPSVWAIAAIDSIGGRGVTRGPRLRSPTPPRGPDVSKVNGRWPINSTLAGQVTRRSGFRPSFGPSTPTASNLHRKASLTSDHTQF